MSEREVGTTAARMNRITSVALRCERSMSEHLVVQIVSEPAHDHRCSVELNVQSRQGTAPDHEKAVAEAKRAYHEMRAAQGDGALAA